MMPRSAASCASADRGPAPTAAAHGRIVAYSSALASTKALATPRTDCPHVNLIEAKIAGCPMCVRDQQGTGRYKFNETIRATCGGCGAAYDLNLTRALKRAERTDECRGSRPRCDHQWARG